MTHAVQNYLEKEMLALQVQHVLLARLVVGFWILVVEVGQRDLSHVSDTLQNILCRRFRTLRRRRWRTVG